MPSPAEGTDVQVLGAGVSGLAATARLAQAGCTVRVLEARDRVGGRIHTVRGDGWPVPVDLGAEFVQGRIPALLGLACQAGLPSRRARRSSLADARRPPGPGRGASTPSG